MKKLILSAVVASGAIFGAYTANLTNDFAISDLQIENVEILAQAETDSGFTIERTNLGEVTVIYGDGTQECMKCQKVDCLPDGSDSCYPHIECV